jgi:hypothetical protein
MPAVLNLIAARSSFSASFPSPTSGFRNIRGCRFLPAEDIGGNHPRTMNLRDDHLVVSCCGL